MQEISPALRELGGLVDDIENYQRPERLPNGDIILRRRADAPPPPPTDRLERLVLGGDALPGVAPAIPSPAVPAPVAPAPLFPAPSAPSAPTVPDPVTPAVPTGPAPRVTL